MFLYRMPIRVRACMHVFMYVSVCEFSYAENLKPYYILIFLRVIFSGTGKNDRKGGSMRSGQSTI